jgi:hypothetical protein
LRTPTSRLGIIEGWPQAWSRCLTRDGGLADVGDGWATGAGRDHRLVAVTADLGILPDKATWDLATNLPRSGGPRRRQPAPCREPGRGGADLRDQVGPSRVASRPRMSWAGRLPGPLRCRDPPPIGPGQLRVQLLLGCLVPRPYVPYEPAARRPEPVRGARASSAPPTDTAGAAAGHSYRGVPARAATGLVLHFMRDIVEGFGRRML